MAGRAGGDAGTMLGAGPSDRDFRPVSARPVPSTPRTIRGIFSHVNLFRW